MLSWIYPALVRSLLTASSPIPELVRLRSIRVTGLRRYYANLRLPSTDARRLVFYARRSGARSPQAECYVPVPGSPWLPHEHVVRLDLLSDPGVEARLAKAPRSLLPAGG